MGLVRYHELYQCGIDWVGVSDINLMYSISWSDISEESKGYGMPLIGDRVTDAQQLKETSPLEQAAKLRRPLLMAYGASTGACRSSTAVRFRDAVRQTNKDVEWVVYSDEGHGWWNAGDPGRLLDPSREVPGSPLARRREIATPGAPTAANAVFQGGRGTNHSTPIGLKGRAPTIGLERSVQLAPMTAVGPWPA